MTVSLVKFDGSVDSLSKAIELGKKVEEDYINEMAIPVPVLFSLAIPSTEVWI